MGKKYHISTIILLILLFIEIIVNGLLLLFIIFFNHLILIDLFTIISIIFCHLAVIGILTIKKYGSYFAIIEGIYGILMRFISPFYINSGLVIGIILNAIIILFGYLEYRFVVLYKPPEPILYQKLYPPQIQVSSGSIDNKYCPNCGIKIKGKFCNECGTKI